MADAPRPWKDVPPTDPAETRAAELVGHAAQIPPRQVDVGTAWDAIIERAMRSPRPRGTPGWAAVLAALLLVVGAGVELYRRGVLGTPAPSFVASSGAQWHEEAGGTVTLELGRIELARAVPRLTLKSPHVTAVALNARFLADTTGAATLVEVYEGEVVVRHGGVEVTLHAGERGTWPDSPQVPVGLVTPAPAPERCTTDRGPERRNCLWTEGERNGLAAQAALFELGLFETQEGNAQSAEAAWHRSLDRFPEGVLAPEVRLSLLVALTKEKRFGEAVAVARDFERLSPGDPRLGEVSKFRAQLEGFAALGR